MDNPLARFKAGAFEPNDVHAMSMALDAVCKTLNLLDGPAREIIAERIVDLARRGIRSPTRLHDRVLREVGLAERVRRGGELSRTA